MDEIGGGCNQGGGRGGHKEDKGWQHANHNSRLCTRCLLRSTSERAGVLSKHRACLCASFPYVVVAGGGGREEMKGSDKQRLGAGDRQTDGRTITPPESLQ